jgi:formamidopyrimidine-DNA glycosylase
MPELPEIETVRRGLERDTIGRRVKSVEVPAARAVRRNGSRKAFQARLEGVKLKAVDRRGSLLVFTLDSGELLVVDIGATGRLLRAAPRDEMPGDAQVVLGFTQGGQLRLVDPHGEAEAFVVPPDLLLEEAPQLADLGLDPVASPVSWTAFAHALVNHRNEKLKALLLDQSFVVGLGGLYADEVLHDAGLRPDRQVSTVSTMEIRRLYRSLVEILHEATKQHGTTTDEHPFTDLQGNPGGFQDELQVWGRDGEPCRRCRQTITRHRAGGRITYWCPSCQV